MTVVRFYPSKVAPALLHPNDSMYGYPVPCFGAGALMWRVSTPTSGVVFQFVPEFYFDSAPTPQWAPADDDLFMDMRGGFSNPNGDGQDVWQWVMGIPSIRLTPAATPVQIVRIPCPYTHARLKVTINVGSANVDDLTVESAVVDPADIQQAYGYLPFFPAPG